MGSTTAVSKKAYELGIREHDLIRALKLVRDLRATAIQDGLDVRAVRVALLFAVKVDLRFAQQRLCPTELRILEEIAQDLYVETLKKWNPWDVSLGTL